MERDIANEIFVYLDLLCSESGIEADFERGELPRIVVYLEELKVSFNIRLLSNMKHSIPISPQSSSQNTLQKHLRVQLWEDQWVYHNDKVKSKIRSLLGLTNRIHARETKVVKIDNGTLMRFLEQNHLNVAIKGKFKYGLSHKGDLVAVISFSKGRTMIRDSQEYESYELLRFCNKLHCTVVGGFSKLLQHFIKAQHPDDIMTYIDADWSNGKSLISMGFKYIEMKEPVEFWLNRETGVRESPHLVMEQKPILEEIKSEKPGDFLSQLGYIKIFNSGSYKLLLKLK